MVDQILRPTADDSIGGWTTESGGVTSLYLSINEATASALEYIQSSADPSNDVVRFKLDPSVVDPTVSAGYAFDYWIGKSGPSAVNLTVRIVQGAATEIATWTHTDIAAGPTPVTQTLTGTQADAITDHTDLYIEFTADSGVVYLLRDQFNDADINPLVDSTATPGPDPRDVTGAFWYIVDNALWGGVQPTSPTWGNSKIVYDGKSRTDGLAMWSLFKLQDKDAELGFGWATSAAVTDPTTNGHHWINQQGYPRVSEPSQLITLNNFPDNGKIGAIRPIEYMPIVVARAQGAFYLLSAAAPQTRTGVNNSNDYIGIPQYPQARVLWVEDTDTTATLYPHIGVLNPIGPKGHIIDDVRVKVIEEWATDAGIADFLDRFDRADSSTSVGTGWTASGGVGGISGNKAYVVSNSGARTFITYPGAASSGDGIWRWKVTVGSTPSDQIECRFRFVDTSNWCQVEFRSGAAWLVSILAGAGNTIANYPFSLSAGQEIDVCVITKGDRYQLILNGVVLLDWVQDTTAANLNGTGIGFGTWATIASGAFWNDVMFVPSIITLPADLQAGTSPHIFTVGSTIAADDFTATDGTALSGRTTPTGGKLYTVDGGVWEINSNQARNTAINDSGDVHHFAYIDAGTTDFEVSGDIKAPAVDDYFMAGFVVRYIDANNHIYVRLRMGSDQPNNDEIEVQEIVGGVAQGIIKGQFGNYYALGSTYNLKLQLVGRVMHVFLNGELVITHMIADLLTGTNVGLYHSSRDDGSSFDTWAVKNIA